MIDFSLDEMLELARQAELQKRVEADSGGREVIDLQPLSFPANPPVIGAYSAPVSAAFATGSRPAPLPEDLRGKLGEDDDSQAHGPAAQIPRRDKDR